MMNLFGTIYDQLYTYLDTPAVYTLAAQMDLFMSTTNPFDFSCYRKGVIFMLYCETLIVYTLLYKARQSKLAAVFYLVCKIISCTIFVQTLSGVALFAMWSLLFILLIVDLLLGNLAIACIAWGNEKGDRIWMRVTPKRVALETILIPTYTAVKILLITQRLCTFYTEANRPIKLNPVAVLRAAWRRVMEAKDMKYLQPGDDNWKLATGLHRHFPEYKWALVHTRHEFGRIFEDFTPEGGHVTMYDDCKYYTAIEEGLLHSTEEVEDNSPSHSEWLAAQGDQDTHFSELLSAQEAEALAAQEAPTLFETIDSPASALSTEEVQGSLWPDFEYLNNLAELDTVSNLRYGILFILALSSLTVYSIILAGWSSNSKYAFLGALRSAAQMISYEVSISLALLPVILLSGSLNLTQIVFSQATTIWYIFPLLPVALIFLVSMLAETNRTPFDLPEAEAELVAGYNVDYSSLPFAMFFLGEYANMILISVLFCILFLGGWELLGCQSFTPFILALKATIPWIFFVLVRATLPRYRYDQLMDIGWKAFLPVTGAFLVFVIGLVTFLGAAPVVEEYPLDAVDVNCLFLGGLFFSARERLSAIRTSVVLGPLWSPLALWTLLLGASTVLLFSLARRTAAVTLKNEAMLKYLAERSAGAIKEFTWVEAPSPILSGFTAPVITLLGVFLLSVALLLLFGVISYNGAPVFPVPGNSRIAQGLRERLPFSGPYSLVLRRLLYSRLVWTAVSVVASIVLGSSFLFVPLLAAAVFLAPVMLLLKMFANFFGTGPQLFADSTALFKALLTASTESLAQGLTPLSWEISLLLWVTCTVGSCAYISIRRPIGPVPPTDTQAFGTILLFFMSSPWELFCGIVIIIILQVYSPTPRLRNVAHCGAPPLAEAAAKVAAASAKGSAPRVMAGIDAAGMVQPTPSQLSVGASSSSSAQGHATGGATAASSAPLPQDTSHSVIPTVNKPSNFTMGSSTAPFPEVDVSREAFLQSINQAMREKATRDAEAANTAADAVSSSPAVTTETASVVTAFVQATVPLGQSAKMTIAATPVTPAITVVSSATGTAVEVAAETGHSLTDLIFVSAVGGLIVWGVSSGLSAAKDSEALVNLVISAAEAVTTDSTIDTGVHGVDVPKPLPDKK